MIIDNSYFTGSLHIPNVIQQPSIGTNTPNQSVQLSSFIDDKQYELLLSFLGYEQTTELLRQFETNGDWKADALQKWKDLVDGKDEWRGLRYTVGANKVSLIANYVYFYFLQQDATHYTSVGVQRPEAANSEAVTPSRKQVSAWNKFIRMYGWARTYYNRPTFFTNWNGTGMMWVGYNQDSQIVTLYDFMTKNNDTYDNTHFSVYSPINEFGL